MAAPDPSVRVAVAGEAPVPQAPGGRSGLLRPLHALLALIAGWLVFTSPWIAMVRRIPPSAGWLDWAHVGLGLVAAPLALAYAAACARGGRWRLYGPVDREGRAALARDLGGLLWGRRPVVEGRGLFALVEGLLLLALLATAATGLAWFALQGTDAAAAWRQGHVLAARALVALVALHVVAVALHLVDLVRD
jgi:cytochrome b561